MRLAIPEMRYEHTLPLMTGEVTIPGIEMDPVPTPSMVFDDIPMYRTGDFGLADLNVGYWPAAVDNGWDLVGLPLFVKRKPLYQYLFVRSDRGIIQPQDLEGRRIGTASYPTAITVLLQGLLRHRHGVDVATLTWVANGKTKAFALHGDVPEVVVAAEAKPPWERLLDGEVDAIISDISDGDAFERLERSPVTQRLFVDYVAEDKKLYAVQGLFPPMHLIVMSRRLEKERPDLAEAIYAAFVEAKQRAYRHILDDRAGSLVVYLRERLVEQMQEWGDPWAYGLDANRRAVDALLDFSAEQGLTRRRLNDEDVFAHATLGT